MDREAGKRRMTNAQGLAVIRGVHTAIYLIMAVSIFVLIYAGVAGLRGPLLWVPLGLLAVETAVFVGSGMRCPLTAIAVKFGARHGQVFDTFLPERLTRHTLTIFGPLMGIGFVLVAARWWLGR